MKKFPISTLVFLQVLLLNASLEKKSHFIVCPRGGSRMLQHPRWSTLWSINYYHKVLHLRCCSSPRSAFAFIEIMYPIMLCILFFLLDIRFCLDKCFQESKTTVIVPRFIKIIFIKRYTTIVVQRLMPNSVPTCISNRYS